MAKLEEIEKQLYEKDKEAQENLARRTKWHIFFPRARSRTPTIWIPEHAPAPKSGLPLLRRSLAYFFGGTFLVLILLAGVFVFFYLRAQGREARIEIQSKETMESGSIVTISVVYKNISHTTLRDGEVVLTLPPGSFIRDQGNDIASPPRISKKVNDLGPGEQGIIEISVRLFGQEHQDAAIQAIYYYRPENLRAKFSARGQKSITVIKVPLALSWDMPETLSRGQDVDINIHYILDSTLPFYNMALRMKYPSGFTLVSAEPKMIMNENIWDIGTIRPEQEGIITLHGTISGEEGERKAFHASIGTYNAATKEWKTFGESSKEIAIAIRPLSIEGSLGFNQERQGVVKPGSELKFTLRYRNNTKTIVKNITVKALFEGSALDLLRLNPDNDGVVDSATGAVVWGPGNVVRLRELSPDERGELELKIFIKDPPPITSEQDKNLTVAMHSFISAASIPDELKGIDLTSDDRIEFKLTSKVIFSGKILHRSSPLANSGPFPPQVGQKTTYTIVWEVKNFTNDIINSEVVAALPPNVDWENITQTDRGTTLAYDKASSEVRWRLGTIPAGTGVLSPTLMGAFQVSLTPALIDRGSIMRLINASRLIGIDSFTKTSVEENIAFMTTELPFDPTAKFGDGTIR